MTKAPTATEKSKKQRDDINRHQHTTMRTDFGWLIGVVIATQLVLLNRFTGFQPSH